MTTAATVATATATASVAATATETRPARDVSIDLLRGFVMVVMVLDHARDFVHGMADDPTNLSTTTPVLFATRWVTHFCAPVFIFLAGTAAYLSARRRTPTERTRFLVSRGLWLVVLELTIIRIGWIPDPGYHFTVFQVIWTIGWSMVALAALSYLPMRALVGISLVAALGHNLLDGIHARDLGDAGWLWNIVHEQGMLHPAPGRDLFVIYPLVPWIFVMALGYAFGQVALMPHAARVTWCRRAGLALIAAFFVLRGINAYGDPLSWSAQTSWPLTVISFFNCTKYPPSLAYLLMTLGPALLAISFMPAVEQPWMRPFVVFGRVPLFFYVAHIFLLRYSTIPIAYAVVGNAAFQLPPQGTGGSPQLPLIYAYAAWLIALLVLYVPCRWYAAVKSRSTSPWMSYI